MAKLLHPVREFRAWRTKAWYRVLHDEKFDKSDKAMHKLGKINHPLTLTACVNLLTNNLPEVRSWAAAEIGVKKEYMATDDELRGRIYDKIEKLLLSDKEYIRDAAIEAITQINDPAFAVRCIGNLVGARKQAYADDISLIIRIIDVLDEYKAKTQNAEKMLRWMLKEPSYERYREDIRNALGSKKGST